MSKLQIFFERGDGHVSKAITWFGQMKSGAAEYSHCGFLVDNAYTIESLLLRGVAHRDWSKYKETADVDVYDIDYKLMPQIWQVKAIIALNEMVGTPLSKYGIGKIPLQALDAITSKILGKPTFLFTKTFGVKYFPICSALLGWGLWNFIPGAARERFKDWRCFSPDDISDVINYEFNESIVKRDCHDNYKIKP